jgi:beta-xylosidase
MKRILLALVLAAPLPALAADRDAGASGVATGGPLPGLRKLMDEPLRDAALCRGPDGTWYLTGTSQPFWGFNNENGIRVWKSSDLVAWEPLGTVWRYGGSPWHRPYLEKKKPIWAPEIHHLKGTFWLTYSLPGWDGTGRTSGCGLLRSVSGKPEGPYEDVQPGERMGDEIDASLFEDDDGAVYFLWHGGKIARLKPDLSGLAEPYRWLKMGGTDPNPRHHSGLCAGIFGKDSFDHVGFEGMSIFKANGRYFLSCAETFDGRYSCAIASSTNLFGPYGARYEALPHAGHNLFFRDGTGAWWSTFFGSDRGAPWQERPGVLPVEISAGGLVRPRSAPPAGAPDSTRARASDGKIRAERFGDRGQPQAGPP